MTDDFSKSSLPKMEYPEDFEEPPALLDRLRPVLRPLRRVSDVLLLCLTPWVLGLMFCQTLCLLPLLAATGLALWHFFHQGRVSPRALAWLVIGADIILFLCMPGPQEGPWERPWAATPTFTRTGNQLRVGHIRDFTYRSTQNYTPCYRDMVLRPGDIIGADFATCYWDGHTAFCHTMLSFELRDGSRIVVSPETRLPKGMRQNALRGCYKNYGLLYVFGTEEDLFRLRTNYRHENLSLYPLRATPEQAERMFRCCMALAARATAKGEAYNTFFDNCSTGLVSALRIVCPELPAWASVHNSLLLQALYSHGALQTREGETQQALQRRCNVGYDLSPSKREDYSAALRRAIGEAEHRTPPELTEEAPQEPPAAHTPAPLRSWLMFSESAYAASDILEPDSRLQAEGERRNGSAKTEEHEDK